MSDTTTATMSPEEMEAVRQRHAAAVRCCLPANGTQIERIVRTRTPLPPEVTAFLNAAWQDVPALDAHAAALTRELEAARAEVERLKPFEPMIRGDITEPTIYVARGFFAQLVSSFDAMNGEANYSVTEVQTADNPHAYEVTVRRKDKPTPHDLRKQAEARVAELEAAALSPPPSPPPGTESPAAAERVGFNVLECWRSRARCDCGGLMLPWNGSQVYRDAEDKVELRCIECGVRRPIPAPAPAAATPAPAGEAAKIQICSECGLRRLWHTNCPKWMPESRNGQNTSAIMRYVKPEESIPHDDGSLLYLAECLHCGARGYIGVSKDRHIIVRDVARQDAAAEKGGGK